MLQVAQRVQVVFMSHFQLCCRRANKVINVLHVIEMSDSELLQEFRDLILCCHLEQVKVLMLLIFKRLLLFRVFNVLQVKCKIISLNLPLFLDNGIIRVGEESELGALMIGQLHMVALMVLLTVFLCLSLELELILELTDLATHTLRHVLA